jgi:uncharacterized protein DUF4236
MGWFLRKSFRFGPIRLNLSKRGLGVSIGVKGARIGVDATGKPYAAGGRYGLYFRERLGRGLASRGHLSPLKVAPASGTRMTRTTRRPSVAARPCRQWSCAIRDTRARPSLAPACPRPIIVASNVWCRKSSRWAAWCCIRRCHAVGAAPRDCGGPHSHVCSACGRQPSTRCRRRRRRYRLVHGAGTGLCLRVQRGVGVPGPASEYGCYVKLTGTKERGDRRRRAARVGYPLEQGARR